MGNQKEMLLMKDNRKNIMEMIEFLIEGVSLV